MKRLLSPPITIALLFISVSGSAALPWRKQSPYIEAAVNDSSAAVPITRGARGAAALRAAILLDRAHFSCGEIDGVYGENVARALAAFRRERHLPQSNIISADLWRLLNEDRAPALARYTITAEDAAGPFVDIPRRMMAKSLLARMGYQSLVEALGEKFHASPELLRRLNPGQRFASGATILVPNVRSSAAVGKAASVVVDAMTRTVSAFDAQGALLANYPATIGSSHDPLPVGTWQILGVARNPVYRYNPGLFWDAEEGDRKATIAAGPNNPVGSVWIDLSKEHYGIHGTPEPSAIGKTFSHGCIRLTNWDAEELAAMVSPGTKAILQRSN